MFKGRQFDPSILLLCVRWYLAYNLSLRDLKEMLAERSVRVDQLSVSLTQTCHHPHEERK